MEGSWQIPKSIARLHISENAKLIYSLLWTLLNSDVVFMPNRGYIAANLGISTYSVDRGIKALKNVGLLADYDLTSKKVKLAEMLITIINNINNILEDNTKDITVNDKSQSYANEYKDIEGYFCEEYKRLFTSDHAPRISYGRVRRTIKSYLVNGYTTQTIKEIIKRFLVDIRYWEGGVQGKPTPSLTTILSEKQFNKYLSQVNK